ncbi:hypothetical protein M0R45_036536 [Rubus argutus]|uniref:F-box domain-containing protein n=1 Tax=Rubus argutus TaxID=59490 RepID=A0AAW1VZS1_RUBAR
MDSDWAELPKHLLDSVLERLVSALDYLRFSVVCKSWYDVAKDNYKSALLLLISSDKEDTWSLYDVMDDKVLDMQVRLPNKRFCGSSKGWLVIVEDNFCVTLLNPFGTVKARKHQENSIIRLPPLKPPAKDRGLEAWIKRCNYFVHKTTISEDPILNANDCIVVMTKRPPIWITPTFKL